MRRRFQYSLRATLVVTALVCLALAGLRCSWLSFYGPRDDRERFLLQFCGGLALAGGAFGSLVGMPFRRSILCGAIGSVALPILATSALIYVINNYLLG
ncbi:MAG TPA: hypothetical protein VG826_19670 [Pirellulales bacterium]|nr:hypothetical protein [Pirellulales bacterium]